MKSVGILGLPQSGKSTLFEILLQGAGHPGHADHVGVVRVPDPRVERLAALFHRKRLTFAQLRFVESAAALGTPHRAARKSDPFAGVRDCDALLVVVRTFPRGGEPARPAADWAEVESELVFNDLAILEGRAERVRKELRMGKKELDHELHLLERCRTVVEQGRPLRAERHGPEEAKLLRGFQLLSLKPCLVVWNRGDAEPPPLPDPGPGALAVTLPALIEREIVALPPADRPAFRAELGIAEDGLSLIIHKSYELLGLISFFTVGTEEVRAWTLRRGDTALDAAAEVHTDFARGFIRAEVVPCEKLLEAGSHAHARERGWLRLEGRDYPVADGDVIEIRFSR